jgi:hypothetical protein
MPTHLLSVVLSLEGHWNPGSKYAIINENSRRKYGRTTNQYDGSTKLKYASQSYWLIWLSDATNVRVKSKKDQGAKTWFAWDLCNCNMICLDAQG